VVTLWNTIQVIAPPESGRLGKLGLMTGEWAQLFYVFLLAAGIEARYVWNSEDHVWTEYWSPELKHWVHVDSWWVVPPALTLKNRR
jgi:hypothetical protein